MTRALLLALVSLVAAPAWALTAADEPGTLDATWTRPTLNQAACEATPTRLYISFDNPNVGGWTQTVYLNAWWRSSGSCSGADIVTDGEHHIGTATIEPGDAMLSTAPFVFPDDFDVAPTPALTTASLLERAGACAAEVEKRLILCVAVDAPDPYGTTTNGKVDTTEAFKQLVFEVDTLPPPAPKTPKVVGLDRALEVQLSSSTEAGAEDTAGWRVRYRALAEAGGESTAGCDAWEEASYKQTTVSSSSRLVLSGLSNGVTYEVCGIAVDALANEGPPSATATGVPQAECSFWECYPEGEVEDGYGCAALGVPVWAGLLAALLLLRRRGRA